MDLWKRGMELPGGTPTYSPNLHSAFLMKLDECFDYGTQLMGNNGLKSPSPYDFSGTRTSPSSPSRIVQPIPATAKMNELQLPKDQSFVSSFSGLTISDGCLPYELNLNPNILLERELSGAYGKTAESFMGSDNSFQIQNGLYHGRDENLATPGMMEDFDSLKFNLLAAQRSYAGIFGGHGGFNVSNPMQNVATMPNHPDIAADLGMILEEQRHLFVHLQSQLSRQRILRRAGENLITSSNMHESNCRVNYLYNDMQKRFSAEQVTSMIRLLDEQNLRILSCSNEQAYSSGLHRTSGLRFHSLSCSEAPETNIPSLRIDKSISGDCLKYFNMLNYAEKSAYLLAKDQEGCRYLQWKILEGRKEDIEKILLEVTDHIVELTMDPFGNYLVQKLFDACDEDQRTQILRVITRRKGDLLQISCDIHGTRVIQKIVESLRTPGHFSIVMSSLKPHILTLMKNANGNHVAQHCLRYLPSKHMELLFESVATNCIELATDRHGCCVLQKCIAHSSGEQRFLLTCAIAFNSRILSQDEFGNYAVQYILDKNEPQATEDILDHLKGHFVDLSMQKYSSNVVESCLKLAGEECHASIVQELIESPQLEQVLQDPYGNYVIQSAIMTSMGTLRSLILKAIKPYIPALLTNPYGKKVLSSKCLKNVKWHLV